MAFSKLAQSDASAMDSGARSAYPVALGGSELKQLARLFSEKSFITGIEKVLRAQLPAPKPGYKEEVEVKVGWIDKRPYAKMASQKRGELGDAAVFLLTFNDFRGPLHCESARALFLQAKVAKSVGQITQPVVPVNPPVPAPGSTTARELMLYGQWPTFDLFEHPRSNTTLAAGVTMIATGQGWFIATPATAPKPNQAQSWPSPWMCGPPVQGALCDETLGSLLARFLAGGQFHQIPAPMPIVAGAEFSMEVDDIDLQKSVKDETSLSGWNRVCVQVLRLTGQGIIPRGYAAGPTPLQTSVTLASFPAIPGLTSLFEWIGNIVARLMYRRMPVLIVTHLRSEGRGR